MIQLCYNSWHPIEILDQQLIKTSIINKRDRGLSMSANLDLWSHGPFKFVFFPDRAWYSQFRECKYGMSGVITELNKPVDFGDEREWWSAKPVRFELLDIQYIVFMSDSPGARIHPRKTVRIWKNLQLKYQRDLKLIQDIKHYPPSDE